jgi:hypothetical protein
MGEEEEEFVVAGTLSPEGLAPPPTAQHGIHRNVLELGQPLVGELPVAAHVYAAPQLELDERSAAHLLHAHHDLDVVKLLEDVGEDVHTTKKYF